MASKNKDLSSLNTIDTKPAKGSSPACCAFEVRNQAEIEKLGRGLASVFGQGDIIALIGDLGAGKTTLARSIIRSAVGAEIDVPSPTFTVMQRYDNATLPITHADFYRLKDVAELAELGIEESWLEGVLLVEWPEIARMRMPSSKLLEITLDWTSVERPEERKIILRGGNSWRDRIKLLTPQ